MFKKIILSVAVILSAGQLFVSGQGFTNLSAPEFKQRMESQPGLLIDTRSKAEYDRGHIEGAVLYELQDPKLKEKLLVLPKDQPLYVYCYSGARSRSVATFLSQNSYTKVVNLQRGLLDWNNSNFATVTGNTAPAKQAPQPDAVSVQEFNKIITSGKLVFIDFYAPWCAPCKQMMPMIDELTTEYKGKVRIVKINGDASKELMQAQKISGVPMLLLYRDGKAVYTKSGKAEKAELVKLFNDNLK